MTYFTFAGVSHNCNSSSGTWNFISHIHNVWNVYLTTATLFFLQLCLHISHLWHFFCNSDFFIAILQTLWEITDIKLQLWGKICSCEFISNIGDLKSHCDCKFICHNYDIFHSCNCFSQSLHSAQFYKYMFYGPWAFRSWKTVGEYRKLLACITLSSIWLTESKNKKNYMLHLCIQWWWQDIWSESVY